MDELDNFDRQLLGYISEHSTAMYGEIAHALDCSKVIVNSRIQNLHTNGYITIFDNYVLKLTSKADAECSFTFKCSSETLPIAEFDWEELYIPLDF